MRTQEYKKDIVFCAEAMKKVPHVFFHFGNVSLWFIIILKH